MYYSRKLRTPYFRDKRKEMISMKTDIYKFEKDTADFDSISGIAVKIAAYNELDKKQELKLTLLCEELVEMLPKLLT